MKRIDTGCILKMKRCSMCRCVKVGYRIINNLPLMDWRTLQSHTTASFYQIFLIEVGCSSCCTCLKHYVIWMIMWATMLMVPVSGPRLSFLSARLRVHKGLLSLHNYMQQHNVELLWSKVLSVHVDKWLWQDPYCPHYFTETGPSGREAGGRWTFTAAGLFIGPSICCWWMEQ